MSEDFKNQHIVPVSYLNHFGTLQKSDNYLIRTRIVKDNKLSKPFKQSTNNVGYICNFYDVPERDDPKYWEHFLDKNFDRLCGKKLEEIIIHASLAPNKTVILDDERKDLLSRIIISQMLRVPKFFEFGFKKAEEITKKTKEELIEVFKEISPDKVPVVEKVEISDTQQKDILLSEMFDAERFTGYCEILKRKTWIVYYNLNAKDTPFITCDNPVLVTNRNGSKIGLFVNGLIQKETSIFFPVSPSVLIAIYSPTAILGGISLFDGQKINLINEQKFIKWINDLLSCQAFKYVFEKI